MAERINPAELETNLLKSVYVDPNGSRQEDQIMARIEVVGRGWDSLVLPLGEEKVIKIYRKGLSFLPQLEFYREITNKAAGREWKIKFGQKKHTVLVNPIDEIISYVNSGRLCAVSKRIFGEKLSMTPLSCSLAFESRVTELGRQLNNDLNVSGIVLDTVNLMFPNDKQKLIIVTDLCARIGILEKIRMCRDKKPTPLEYR